MLVFFTNLNFMELLVRYLALLRLFLVIDGFVWFWMESLRKNIELILVFLTALFFVPHVLYYTSMTFLMMLSAILLSMLMILLFTPSVLRYLICDNNYNWLLNETLWTWAGGLLISMLEKLNFFRLTILLIWCYWCKNWWVWSWRKIIF